MTWHPNPDHLRDVDRLTKSIDSLAKSYAHSVNQWERGIVSQRIPVGMLHELLVEINRLKEELTRGK